MAAGVLGRSFDWTLLPEMCSLPEQAVLEALRAGMGAQLIVTEPSATGSFRFRHALTRDAVIDRLLPMERAALARRALAAIEAAHPGLPGAWCDLSARLAERAGDRPRAAALLLASGQRSLERGPWPAPQRPSSAPPSWPTTPPWRPTWPTPCATRCSLGGTVDHALEVGAALATALEALGAPPERRGLVDLRLASAAAVACRWDVADDHLGRARGWFAAADDEALMARVDAIAAQVALGRGELERASELAGSALAIAERAGDHDLTCEALEVMGRCERLRDIMRAEETFERARAVAEQHHLALWEVRAVFELGTIDLFAATSDSRLQRARDLALATGALTTAAQVELHLTWWHVDQFEPEQAAAAAVGPPRWHAGSTCTSSWPWRCSARRPPTAGPADATRWRPSSRRPSPSPTASPTWGAAPGGRAGPGHPW